MEIRRHSQYRDINASDASKAMIAPRHRWYYYKEGFSPELVSLAIDRLQLNDDSLVIDPFNGSGTVTLQSSIQGVASIGIEVNPFTSFISRTKNSRVKTKEVLYCLDDVVRSASEGKASPLLEFSTFSEKCGKDKWLFNSSVLNAFEGAKEAISGYEMELKNVFLLALIGAAMDNCNCRRDGKCLKYKTKWQEINYNERSFIQAFKRRISMIVDDIESTPILTEAQFVCADSRAVMEKCLGFDLCITSPPYLNTFDYTDIYRPELFLGGFVSNNEELYNLRLKTIRSHIQAKWDLPIGLDLGPHFVRCYESIVSKSDQLMHCRIPAMIQAYFEDMSKILLSLNRSAKSGAEVWLVVSTSAYANVEIPVDIIIGDIGQKMGWNLSEINVMRVIRKRKTSYSPNISCLRESLVMLKKL